MQSFSRNYSYQHHRRLPAPKQRRRLLYIQLACFTASLVIVSTIVKSVFFNSNSDSGVPHALALSGENEQPAKKEEPPKRQVDTSNLQVSLDQIIKQYPYDTSVSVIDLNSDKLIQTGDSYPFIAASTTKLLTALLYMSKAEAGQTSLDSQIGGKSASTQLQLAVNRSDNDAWHKLNDYLGKDSLAAYALSKGVTTYDAKLNTITSNDMALLLAKLYKRELLNEENTKLLMSWMQNTSEERFIPAGVPEGMSLYHKAGYLPERVHDVAIIDNGTAPFVVVIYSKSYTATYDYSKGQKLFRKVTEQVITTFK